VAIGELHNYKKFRDRPKTRNVVDSYAQDPIFAELDALPMSAWHASILQHAMRGNPTLTTLVDNSKRVEWCKRLLRNPTLNVKPVHLIRDPRALVRYWLHTYTTQRQVRQQRIRLVRATPLRAAQLLTCSDLEVYIEKWLARNRDITNMLASLDARANVLSYHDLVTDTTTSLTQLMPRIDLGFEPSQLAYGRATQHGTQKREYADETLRSQIRFDQRWRSDLSAAQIDHITGHDQVQKYLRDIAFQLTPDGITHTGEMT
jgi:hypothetical protein